MLDSWVAVTLISVLAAYALVNRGRKPLWLAIAFCLFTLVSIVGLAAYVAADSMTGRGIDQSVLYHLTAGVPGAGFQEFLPQIAVAASGGLLCVVMIIGTLYHPHTTKSRQWRGTWVATAALVGVALYANPGLADAVRIISIIGESRQAQAGDGRIAVPPGYVTPRFKHPPRRNLVWLYLESFERTYTDETRFPGLTPNLRQLRTIATDFTDIRQVHGTNWSLAGQVASQCGVPLEAPLGFGNSRQGVDIFLPGAVCLGDLLGEAGYRISYMQGADIKFAGADRFFRQHGYQRALGLYELEERAGEPDYRSSWGLYDDMFLDQVRAQIEDRAGSPDSRPFAVLALTLDTHPPKGHVSRSCTGVIYGDGADPMLNAVHCTDRLVAAFVRKLLETPSADSPLIVIQSDHLVMESTATKKLEAGGGRRNLFMVIDPLAQVGRAVSRPATMLDVGATVADMLGSGSDGFGFGRSLIGKAPTLAERHADVDAYLHEHRPFLRDLWQFPDLSEGVTIDVVTRTLRTGKRFLQYPLLLQLTADLQIEDMFLRFNNYRPMSHVIADFDPATPFLLVDECAVAEILDRSFTPGAEPEVPDYCVVLSSGNGRASKAFHLNQTRFFSSDSLSALLTGPADPAQSPKTMARKRTAIRDLLHLGAVPDHSLSLDSGWGVRRLILRAGGFSASHKTAIFTGVKSGDRLDLHFERGLTLFGVDKSGAGVTPLFTFDTCALMPDLLARYGSIEQAIRALSLSDQYQDHELFVLMSEDSAYCGEREPLAAVQRLYGLRDLEGVGFRAPYVAVMSRKGVLFEAAGQSDRNLLVAIGWDLPDTWHRPQ